MPSTTPAIMRTPNLGVRDSEREMMGSVMAVGEHSERPEGDLCFCKVGFTGELSRMAQKRFQEPN